MAFLVILILIAVIVFSAPLLPALIVGFLLYVLPPLIIGTVVLSLRKLTGRE